MIWLLALDAPSLLLDRKPAVPMRTFANEEGSGEFALAAVTVPSGGWRVTSATVFAEADRLGWDTLKSARLTVLPRTSQLPTLPLSGETVSARARLIGSTVEIQAKDLDLTLKPGEYWIGLTPVAPASWHRPPRTVGAYDRYAERFADLVRVREGKEPVWRLVEPSIYFRAGDRVAIRLEGTLGEIGQRERLPAEPGGKLILLRTGTFDPTTRTSRASSGSLWIAQFRQVVDESARQAIAQAGCQIKDYLPEDAYVVRGDRRAINALRRSLQVRCVTPYLPEYRIDPDVLPERLTVKDGDRVYRGPSDEERGVRNVSILLFDRDAAAKRKVIDEVRRLGRLTATPEPEALQIEATLALDAIRQIAKMDEVCAIERGFAGREQSLSTSGEGDLITLDQVRLAGGIPHNAPYQGMGVNVGVIDDGIREDHLDFITRPVRFVGPRDPRATSHHGTPVAGIITGEGRTDPASRGLAPLARLTFAERLPYGAHRVRYSLMRGFAAMRTSLVSESAQFWPGDPFIHRYDGGARMLDDIVSLHDILVVQSMGNATPGNGTGGSWSKNALMVGGVHPHGTLDEAKHRPIYTRGPIPEERIKPDLVHFAFNVLAPSSVGVDRYESFGGTSCAAPLVSGHAVLAIDAWANNAFETWPSGGDVFARRPHAATLKALLINTARAYQIGNVFSRDDQGWGRPHIGNLLAARGRCFAVDESVRLRNHESITYSLVVPPAEPSLRATLAYTDPPGSTIALKALVNDLDLTVTAPGGTIYRGNNGLRTSTISVSGGTPDRVNNVENVFLDSPEPGVWLVRVAAHRIAIPRNGGQAFGLFVTGIRQNNGPSSLWSRRWPRS